MKAALPRPGIYTIPPDAPFALALVEGIMAECAGAPETLPRYTVLLPTRRACRTVRETFLQCSHGRPLLLPRLQPLGDVDEEELSILFSGQAAAAIPPALSPLKRQMLLARLIGGMPGFTHGAAQDVRLAHTLGRLMDQIYTENLSLSDLPALVDRDAFARHWQITLDFLSILSEYWPQILTEHGVIDAADRRNRLIETLAGQWAVTPPAHPVIAAGSTGSIPATARLLGVIARMPQGRVILPGLDRDMDEDSWDAVDDTHPQATLKSLLDKLECRRTDVRVWHGYRENSDNAPRRLLTSEMMRPAETTEQWRTLVDDPARAGEIENALTGLYRYDCATPQEEALVIAAALREVLNDDDRTAALITPDRGLARRVAMTCRRWGIEIDDSAGQKLSETPVGTFLRLSMGAAKNNLSPVSLLALLKHALARPESYPGSWHHDVARADAALRGPLLQRGLDGLRERLHSVPELKDLLMFLDTAFAPLLAAVPPGGALFSECLNIHLALAETLCPPERLWAGDDGETAASFLAELRDQAVPLSVGSLSDYAAILETLMEDVSVRPSYGRHPRLKILGQLEARMTRADRIVLAGLNEGMWPPAPAADPWMSRPMRHHFGLPSPDRGIGLAAHDFVQGLCAPEVILTRSVRVDGTPTVPARFLSRLSTTLQGAGVDPERLNHGNHLYWASQMENVQDVRPAARPAPAPPVAARPRQLSVTKIESWLNDPYSIYARYVLRLVPLKPLEEPVEAALKGILLHGVLARLGEDAKDAPPPDMAQRILALAADAFAAYREDPGVWSFWQPRLARMAEWLYDHEQSWRTTWKILAVESEGRTVFEGPRGPFTLTARADRIDVTRDGAAAAIIDYKHGGTYSKKGMLSGKLPQLPLEALILSRGGFDGLPALPSVILTYWVLHGGRKYGDSYDLDRDVTLAIENARAGLENLIAAFDDPATPYLSLPDLSRAPRFNDYEHLARVKEWTALGEYEEAG